MRRENRKLFTTNKNTNKYSPKKTTNSEKETVVFTHCFKANHSCELLDFLLAKCKTSRNNIKNFLTSRKVLINGSVVTQYNFMLAKDDEVKISKHSLSYESFKPSKKQINKKTSLPFNIIYEDQDFIAINKPAGLLSVESDKDRNCAFGYLFDYLQNQNKSFRPFILHRIDKETSGVLVFAKNIKIHSMLKMKWNEFVKTRQYIAIVEGQLKNNNGTITSYLKENKNNLVYSTHDTSGQKAITHYEVINKNDEYSMLNVLIDSGRKNQIRVHMQDLNCPVVGDNKYGHNKNPLNRLGLHAYKLEFTHPITKKLISITAPIPDSFKKLFS